MYTGSGDGWDAATEKSEAFALGVSLTALADQHAAWSRRTFGEDHEKGPTGALRHMKAECDETIEAVEQLNRMMRGDETGAHAQAMKVGSEYADLLLLLLDSSRRSGVSPAELVRFAHAKMQVNKTRVYKRTPDGVPSMHVRSGRGGWWSKVWERTRDVLADRSMLLAIALWVLAIIAVILFAANVANLFVVLHAM